MNTVQSDIFVYTIMTHDRDGWFVLLESAKRWGWPIRPCYLGGEKWHTDPAKGMIPTPDCDQDQYEAFIESKHLYMKKELEKAYLKGYKRYFYLDGWDTKIIGDLSEVPWDSPMYFSAEGPHPVHANLQNALSYPDPRYAPLFPAGVTYPYVNAGVQWGYIEAYVERCPEYTCLDQLVWNREYVFDPTGIKLDTEAQTVLNLYGLLETNCWQRREDTKRWVYLPTGSTPCVIHANGNWELPGWIK